VKTLDLIQGSPEWLAHRAQHFNASDAPAMLGVSPYKTRAQLLREMHTGVVAEVDTATHMRFQNGHRAESLARPLAENIINEDLYPVTGTEGKLSASFDGLTLDERAGFEHKALNEELRAAFEAMSSRSMSDFDGCRMLPIHHRVQMEQQMMVSGATRVLFMASEWTADGELVDARHCWYYPDHDLRDRIIDGWAQFERDLAAYVLPESAEPAPVGKAPDSLPALRIEVSGQVTASNLAEFKQTALATIRAVNRDLKTDQDFADAEKASKWCADVESRLKAAKEHALSQTATIDALFKALDDIGAEARTVRLDLDKLVARRKVEVKEEAVAKARRALDQHIAALNAEIAPFRAPYAAPDFAGAIKGLRSFASMQDALDSALANGKIAADAAARDVRKNIEHFKEVATGLEALFSDLGQLVHKSPEDFRALVQARVLAQQERDRKAEEARQAAEAQRIAAAEQRAREQEAARIAAELAAQRAESERLEKLAEERRAAAQREAQAAEARAEQQAASKRIDADRDAAAALRGSLVSPVDNAARIEAARHIVNDIIAADTVRDAIAASRADEPANLTLGAISARLGITMTGQFVETTLRVAPARLEKAAKLYTETQFSMICCNLQTHIAAIARRHSAVEAA
jgi:putative phage-type endonuclease